MSTTPPTPSPQVPPPDLTSVETLQAGALEYLRTVYTGVDLNSHGDIVVPRMGNTAAAISFDERTGVDRMMVVRSPIVLEAPLTEELERWVGSISTRYAIGNVRLLEHEAHSGVLIEFATVQLAETISWNMLQVAVVLVGSTAHELGPEVRERFGGHFLYDDPSIAAAEGGAPTPPPAG